MLILIQPHKHFTQKQAFGLASDNSLNDSFYFWSSACGVYFSQISLEYWIVPTQCRYPLCDDPSQRLLSPEMPLWTRLTNSIHKVLFFCLFFFCQIKFWKALVKSCSVLQCLTKTFQCNLLSFQWWVMILCCLQDQRSSFIHSSIYYIFSLFYLAQIAYPLPSIPFLYPQSPVQGQEELESQLSHGQEVSHTLHRLPLHHTQEQPRSTTTWHAVFGLWEEVKVDRKDATPHKSHPNEILTGNLHAVRQQS